MAVTSRDVALELGLSQSTVSRALRGDPRVAVATQTLVTETAAKMNYIPNVAARSLITARTQTVGVIVSDITNPFYPQIVNSLHDELGLSGYRMVLLHERAGGHRSEVVPQLQGRSVDGLVFTSATLESDAVDWFSDRGVPVVLLNRDVEGAAVDRVLSDTRLGGGLAADLLARLGHSRIGLISGPSNASTSRGRERGFLDGLARLGIAARLDLHRRGEFSYESGHQWARELLSLPEPPTALFCGNDVMAFGALDAARQIGIQVPDELSVVGSDDIDMAAWAAFDLSTINQPLARMAKAAARMMVSRIESDAQIEPRTQIFPASVVLRGTTAPWTIP
jgi:LacI family transcriptional regulator